MRVRSKTSVRGNGLSCNKAGIWYVDKRVGGKRYKFSVGTRDFNLALQRYNEFVAGGHNKDSLVSRRMSKQADRLASKAAEGMSDAWARAAITRARSGAKSRGLSFALSTVDVLALSQASGGRCSLSGIEFDLSGECRHPYSPSIDRIDSSKGYTLTNCRLVCLMVNIALSNWGDESFVAMCVAVANRHGTQVDQATPNRPKLTQTG